MTTNNFNTAQPSHQRMLRSHGPSSVFDHTHLNNAGCYIRSHNITNQQSNVNISFKTISPTTKAKREHLVTEIARLLGSYAGDWFAPTLRPRNLPVHPLDWSTSVLEYLYNAAQALPHTFTTDQRCSAIRDAMSNGPSTHPPNTANANKPHPSRRPSEAERLRIANQQLTAQVQGLNTELGSLRDRLADEDETVNQQLSRIEKMEFFEFAKRALAEGRYRAYTYEELQSAVEGLWASGHPKAVVRSSACNQKAQPWDIIAMPAGRIGETR